MGEECTVCLGARYFEVDVPMYDEPPSFAIIPCPNCLGTGFASGDMGAMQNYLMSFDDDYDELPEDQYTLFW